MSRKLRFVCVVVSVLGAALWAGTPSAWAQDPDPAADAASCQRCHADLYYLHDTGKWHCLCAATPSCLHCHGGQAGAATEAEAHAGMLADPLQANAAVCQQCHGTETDAHVATFLVVAGGAVSEGSGLIYPTPAPEPTDLPGGGLAYVVPGRLAEPWREAGLALAVVGLAGLGGYGGYLIWVERTRPLAP